MVDSFIKLLGQPGVSGIVSYWKLGKFYLTAWPSMYAMYSSAGEAITSGVTYHYRFYFELDQENKPFNLNRMTCISLEKALEMSDDNIRDLIISNLDLFGNVVYWG